MIAPINDCLNETAWGRATWDDVCRCFVDLMPDVVPIVRNVDLIRRTVNTMFVEGIEAEHIAAYRQHYVTIDPWIDLVAVGRHGQVGSTETHHPSASFRDSEFYNDWLSRQDNLKAATGIRIDIDANNAVIICLHYKVERAPSLDGPASEILKRIKPELINAVRSAAMLRSGLEQTPRLGALIETIGGSAVLVDAQRHICEANAKAMSAMESGEICSSVSNVLTLRDPNAQRWLEEMISRLLVEQATGAAVATFMTGDQVYRISMRRAPDHGKPGIGLLVHPRPHVLVVISLLTGASLRLDAEALRLAYGLSRAESRLCEMLANGYSLVESAQRLHISEGTVRQRAKAVFHKTGTHRQGELIARVSHFAV